MNIGFSSYDPVVNTNPTTQEMLASLSAAQKLAILDGFAHKVPIFRLKRQIFVNSSVIRHLYGKIDDIEELSRKLMRGEILVSEAVYNALGEEISPAVYQDPIETSTALREAVKGAFVDDFTSAQVGAVLAKMVQFSKMDGTALFAYYKAEVVK